jgi:flavin-dependent dehydrogenase
VELPWRLGSLFTRRILSQPGLDSDDYYRSHESATGGGRQAPLQKARRAIRQHLPGLRALMFDVVIAGAGPAGAVAALVLARGGARVLALDRARFPRDKLCGDTVNPGALAVLVRLGLAGAVAGALQLEGMIVTGADGARVVGRYGTLHGGSLSRRQLDAALAREASAAGAQIDENVLVLGPLVESTRGGEAVTGLRIKRRDGRELPVAARIVIAADGRHSRVGRTLGLSRAAPHPRRWAVGAYFDGVEGLANFGEMHVRHGHYIGVAPLPGGLGNACLVASALRRIPPRELLVESLSADPLLRERFRGARIVSNVTCLGPLAVDCPVAGAPGLLLAGDAAGFVDPMTGDGLRFAFRGGELAALEALRTLEHGGLSDAHRRLGEVRATEFGSKWRFNRTMRLLVAHPGAVRAAEYAAALAPRVLQRAIRYAGDVHAA